MFVIFALMGCSLEPETSAVVKTLLSQGASPEMSQVALNQLKWQSAALSSYQFEFSWQCFCLPDYVAPVLVTVREGIIDSVVYTHTRLSVDADKLSRYLTIDELFTFIQSAIDEEAIKIVSEYDLEYGFPTKVWIDWNEMIADEERGFQVSNLVEVEFEANQIWIIQDLPITEIDIRPVLSQPLNQKRFTSVEATVNGYLPDSCTQLHRIQQTRLGQTVYLRFRSKRPKEIACLQIITEVSYKVILDSKFIPGQTYELQVNGKSKVFNL